jgi:hypothetical protein
METVIILKSQKPLSTRKQKKNISRKQILANNQKQPSKTEH